MSANLMLSEHLPFNDFDMSGITNMVTHYKTAGLETDYDVSDQADGVVLIMLENPFKRDGSGVMFKLHKLARPGFFRKRAHWVVQVFSVEDGESKQRGCLSGRTQAHALTAAELDMKHGFLSIATFDMAAEAD